MAVGTTCPLLHGSRRRAQKIFFRAYEDTFQAVTSVTLITTLQSVDYQQYTKMEFCNTALKIEQTGRFSNKSRFCYKKLQEVTAKWISNYMISIMLHLLRMLHRKTHQFRAKI